MLLKKTFVNDISESVDGNLSNRKKFQYGSVTSVHIRPAIIPYKCLTSEFYMNFTDTRVFFPKDLVSAVAK